jgi:hypothetical protein
VTKYTHRFPEDVASLLVAGALNVYETEHVSYLRVSPTVWRRGNMRAVRFGQVRRACLQRTCALVSNGTLQSALNTSLRRCRTVQR